MHSLHPPWTGALQNHLLSLCTPVALLKGAESIQDAEKPAEYMDLAAAKQGAVQVSWFEVGKPVASLP